MPEKYRVLVTGSRDWDDREQISHVLRELNDAIEFIKVLVSGACPTGADRICEEVAAELGWEIERHPADWKAYGKSAGFIRNTQMVESRPFLCYAFIKDHSKGATHTADLARKAGVPTAVIRA